MEMSERLSSYKPCQLQANHLAGRLWVDIDRPTALLYEMFLALPLLTLSSTSLTSLQSLYSIDGNHLAAQW